MKKTLGKILNIVVDVLIVLVLIVSVLTLTMVFTTTQGGDGVPNLFGKAPVSVLSDSMKGDKEDNFNKGDLLLCDVVDGAKTEFKVGDIVTFRQDINGDGNAELVTHRLYKQNKDGSFQTKGDNNDIYDQAETNSIIFSDIRSEDVLAVYHGSKISGIGGAIDFLRSPTGFFICILLPMIIFFLYQAVRVVINAMAYSKEKGMQKAQEMIANADLTEEQKQKAIAEYLAAQNGEQKPEEPAESPAETEEAPEEKQESEAQAEESENA